MRSADRRQKTLFPLPRRFWALRLILVFLLVTLIGMTSLANPVMAMPTIIGSALPNGQVNTPYLAILTAVPLVPPPITWAITSGALPPGLALTASNGTISGTPITAGTFPFFVTVTDSTGSSPQQSFFITIAPPPFIITTESMPQGKEGAVYTASLTVNSGISPYNWTLASGNLPAGLILNQTTGVLSGTLSKGTAGTSTFMLNVTDSSSPARSAQKTFSIYIEKGAYQSIISINSSLTAGNTKVSFDGRTATTLKGGEAITYTFDLGTTRSISVEPIVAHPTDSGIRFKAKEESITISEAQPNADFSYYTEYQVTVTSEPTLNTPPKGSGWYRKDSSVTASTKTEVEGNAGTLYRFAYWVLPSGNQIKTEDTNFTVDSPVTITARYDTFYKLTIESIYGEVEGSGWYKANTQARWMTVNDKVAMPGIVGFFQGKYKAVNPSGNETMDKPKTVTLFWEPDYTMPYILIPVTIIIFILAIAGIYFLLRRQQPQPQPQTFATPIPYPPVYMQPPPPPRPVPQQHTTVVMIGDKGTPAKQLPSSTKEQLMEKFGELLEKYESEIKTSQGPKELPRVGPSQIEKMIQGPQPTSSQPQQPVVNAEFTQSEAEDQQCPYTAKKLVRTVTGSWKQLESDTITLPSATEGKEVSDNTGVLVVWSRDIYHEWEVVTCNLILNHEGKHKGGAHIAYSLLNAITEKKIYSSITDIQPPKPHFTDGMSQEDISDDQVVPADELPSETIK
jgi:hypothetical protein